MACKECKDIVETVNKDIPHVVRKCKSCGREMKICPPGDHGIGITVEKGDRFVMPAGWFNIHANPLKGRGQLTKAGLEWFAKLIFLAKFPRQASQIEDILKENDTLCTNILQSSDLLAELDLEKEEDARKFFDVLKENQDTAEWFAYTFSMFNNIASKAIEQDDAQKAAWAMAGAERFRSMLVFKQELETVVWMGHSAKRLVDLLEVWDGNRSNPDEAFWQIQFNQHAYVLSQVFSVPVVFIQDKAYVGGMSLDRKDARFVDFLYSGDTSDATILIEIKTPETPLLGRKYRNIYKPSAEMSGALIQIKDYKLSLIEHLATITQRLEKKLTAFDPRCLIIAGNGEAELTDQVKRRSFELFRWGLQNIEVITYDELFKKAEVLASLFNLTRKKK
jgi:hypothetical protein